MTTPQALVESWNRTGQALSNVLDLLTPELLELKPSEDGWSIAFHLAHLHNTRRYWLTNVLGRRPEGASLYTQVGEDWVPSVDLFEIRERLSESEALIREWIQHQLDEESDEPVGNYDHPVLFLQHMVWHEGWHFALIMLALRLGGHEPSEQWEEAHVWDLWRLPD